MMKLTHRLDAGPVTQFMKDEYRTSKSDLFAGFIERCTELVKSAGLTAMVTMQSWMFLSSFEKLRTSLLIHQRIVSMLHLGARAFDSIGGEIVSSTAFVLENHQQGQGEGDHGELGIFIRLVDGTSEAAKCADFRNAMRTKDRDSGYHVASAQDFEAIPGTPIVYWLSEKMRAVFAAGMELGEVASLAVGLQTGDNNRFLRLWWEVSQTRTAFGCMSREEATASGARWFPYNKGGDFRRWYGNQEFVVNWENDGASIRAFGTGERSRPRSRAQNMGTYFSPSVSWSDISSGAPSFRSFPAGFIHGNKGNSIFGVKPLLNRLLGIMNSPCATALLEAVVPTMTASVGDVAKTPLPSADWDLPEPVIERLVQTSRADWDDSETSWGFTGSPLLKAGPVQAS